MQTLLQSTDTSRLWLRRFGRVGALLILVCLICSAESRPVSPSEVEAAYLYNFGKFVNWPSPPDSISAPFNICTLGKDDFGEALNTLIANEDMQGRKIAVKRLASVEAAEACQIVFLAPSEESRMAKDLDALKEKPILTVSSVTGFLERGGMIQFVLQNNKVRFAVNLSPALRSHLALSSELLKVAVYVSGKPSAGTP